MINTTQNGISHDDHITFRLPALANHGVAIKDAGQVRPGGQGPLFRRVAIADAGTVRLGGQSPAFLRPSIIDTGRVRLGGQGPLFR